MRKNSFVTFIILLLGGLSSFYLVTEVKADTPVEVKTWSDGNLQDVSDRETDNPSNNSDLKLKFEDQQAITSLMITGFMPVMLAYGLWCYKKRWRWAGFIGESLTILGLTIYTYQLLRDTGPDKTTLFGNFIFPVVLFIFGFGLSFVLINTERIAKK